MREFYLVCSEVFFTLDDGMVFQIQLAKDHRVAPLTRDYLAARPEPANRNETESAEHLDRAS